MATTVMRRCIGLTTSGMRCKNPPKKGLDVCARHDPDNEVIVADETGMAPAGAETLRLADIATPETINVGDALEQFAAEAWRMVDFTRRQLEACDGADPRWGTYHAAYNRALGEATKIAKEFAKVGLDKYRAAERTEVARLIAELVVLLIGRFVPKTRQKEATAFARGRLVVIAGREEAKAS